jgi:hypothetical protein
VYCFGSRNSIKPFEESLNKKEHKCVPYQLLSRLETMVMFLSDSNLLIKRFFHQITSLPLDHAQQIILGVSGKLLKLMCFLIKNQGGKNMGVKQRILLIKWSLLSFPQFLSVGAVILQEVPQHTPKNLYFNDQCPLMLRKNTFYASN